MLIIIQLKDSVDEINIVKLKDFNKNNCIIHNNNPNKINQIILLLIISKNTTRKGNF